MVINLVLLGIIGTGGGDGGRGRLRAILVVTF